MAHPHPAYPAALTHPMGQPPEVRESGQGVLIGDEVALVDDPAAPVGVVEAVYRESVELSTGEQLLVGDLVLIRRDAR